MFLPIEVARLVEQERRQQSERRIRWLAVIREQRMQASPPVHPPVQAPRPGGRRTGPPRAYDTGPRG